MKQIKILGVLAVALTLGLAACNGGGESSVSKCEKHDWDKWVTVKEATCKEKGSQERTCKVCGEKETKEIKLANHNYQEVAGSRVEAQVGQAGSYQEKCTVCGDVQTRTIPALVPSVSITGAALRLSEGKVYLDIKGSQQYYTAANFKWAFGLKKQGQDSYLIGKAAESLTEEDYTIVGTINDDNTFVASYPLTDIPQPQGFNAKKNGLYNIYAGPYVEGNGNYTTLSVSVDDAEGTNTADDGFNYYFRNDQETSSVLTIGIMGNIAPFHCETAKAEFVAGVGEKEPGVRYTAEELAAIDLAYNKTTDDYKVEPAAEDDPATTDIDETQGIKWTQAEIDLAAACHGKGIDEVWKKEPVMNPDQTFAEIGGKWRNPEDDLAAVQAALAELLDTPAVDGVKYTAEEIAAAIAEDPTFDKTTDDYKIEPVAAVTGPVFLQFQTQGGGGYYAPTGHGSRNARNPSDAPITYSFRAEEKADGIYAYIRIDVSFFGSISDNDLGAFNTHMNLSENAQENCVMEGDFEEAAVALPGGTRELVIFSHPAGGNSNTNAYGNLAFKVQAKSAA